MAEIVIAITINTIAIVISLIGIIIALRNIMEQISKLRK